MYSHKNVTIFASNFYVSYKPSSTKIKLEGPRENLSAPPEFVESDDIGSAGALEDSDDDEDADDLEYDIDCLVEYLEEEF